MSDFTGSVHQPGAFPFFICLSNFSKPFTLYLCKYTVLLYPLDKYWFKYYYMYMFKYFLGGIL